MSGWAGEPSALLRIWHRLRCQILIKLVLVLDSSGSMQDKIKGGTKIAVAVRALSTVVDHLPDDHRFAHDRAFLVPCTSKVAVLGAAVEETLGARRQ